MSNHSPPARETDPPFSHKSGVSITHEQNIICRQLFVGHVVGSQPMEKGKNPSNDNDVYLDALFASVHTFYGTMEPCWKLLALFPALYISFWWFSNSSVDLTHGDHLFSTLCDDTFWRHQQISWPLSGVSMETGKRRILRPTFYIKFHLCLYLHSLINI